MGKKSRTKRGRGQGNSDPLPPELEQAVRESSHDPHRTRVARELAEELWKPEVCAVFLAAPRGHRAGLFLAMRHAYTSLLDRKPCDLCTRIARRIRLLTVHPGTDFRGVHMPDQDASLAGFATLCLGCARMSSDERDRRFLDKYRKLQDEHGTDSHPKVTIVGQRIGSTRNLPPRCAIQDCSRCSRPIWFDQDEHDHSGVPESLALFVCRECAEVAIEEGVMECVPDFLSGLTAEDAG